MARRTTTLRSNPDIREVAADIENQILEGMATWIWEDAFSTWLEYEIQEGRIEPRADVRHMATISDEDPAHAAAWAAALGFRALVAKAEKTKPEETLMPLFELAYIVHTGDELDYGLYTDQDRRYFAKVDKLAKEFGTYLAAAMQGSGVNWSDSHLVKRKTDRGMLTYVDPNVKHVESHFYVNYLAPGTLAQAGLSWPSTDYNFPWPYQANGSKIPTIEDGPAVMVVEAYTNDEGDDLGSSITEVSELNADQPIKRVIAALDVMRDEPNIFDTTSDLAIDPINGSTWFTKDPFEAEDGATVRYSFVLRSVPSSEVDMIGMIVNDTRAEYTQVGGNAVGNERYDMGDLIFLTDNASWTRNVYVLWFGRMSYERYVIFANSLDDALNEGIDYLQDTGSDIFVDEVVAQRYLELRAEYFAAKGEPDRGYIDDRDDSNLQEEAEVDTVTGGNNGRRINSDDWGIVAENPSLAQLVEIAYRRTR